MSQQLSILALNWRCLRHPQAGGSEVNLFEQARRWVRDGHRVTVLCGDPGRDAVPTPDEVDGGVVIRRMGGRLSVYLWVAWFLLRYGHQYDVILDVANGIPFFSPLFTLTPTALLVHHVHGRQWFVEFPRLLGAVGWCLERYVVPLVYGRRPVIAVSTTTRDDLVVTGVPEELIRIVHNGTELPPPRLAASWLKSSTAAKRRIVYLGRLKRYKRVDRLVRAVANLRREFPDVHLDIAGEGDARTEVETLVETLGLHDCVTVHGFVTKEMKDALLWDATVFAMPSMHEGWGLSVIEANGHGCPAVAYDVPGLRVAIRDGMTGLLAQDDESFEQGLGTLLRDSVLRQQYSEAALAWAGQFSWEACATGTLEVLQQCTTRRGLTLPAFWPSQRAS